MTFSEKLNEMVGRAGLKPVGLAAKLAEVGIDTTVQTVEYWLSGDREPRLSTALVIADICGFSLDDVEPKNCATTVNGTD